jgi:hypothetical protein
MDWYRVYQGLPYDAKLGVVARRSGLSKAETLALYICLFDAASRAEGGSVKALDPEATGIALDIDPAKIETALAALAEKGLVDDAGCIAGWQRLKPCSTARVQAHRRRRRGRGGGKRADPDCPAEARRRRARLEAARRETREAGA